MPLLCTMATRHRFLLIIRPGEAVSAFVTAARERLHARIGSFGGRRVVPHLTLFFADLEEELGQRLQQAVESTAVALAPFGLTYSGITHFPDERTIYIDPVEKERIGALRASLATAAMADPRIGHALRETDHPHLTIAAGLRPQQFEEAWGMLAPHRFAAAEEVRQVQLLRRPLVPGADYALMAAVPLG